MFRGKAGETNIFIFLSETHGALAELGTQTAPSLIGISCFPRQPLTLIMGDILRVIAFALCSPTTWLR